MSGYVLLENKNLLEMAKDIFGDIVENAYAAPSFYDDALVNEEEDQEAWYDINLENVNSKYFENKEKDIRYDDLVIVILFNSGNYVKFKSSEWAFISKVNASKIKKVKFNGNEYQFAEENLY